MIGGYSFLFLAFAFLVGPTILLAKLRQPQIVALKLDKDRPVAMSAKAQIQASADVSSR